jgi:hypothetical protein
MQSRFLRLLVCCIPGWVLVGSVVPAEGAVAVGFTGMSIEVPGAGGGNPGSDSLLVLGDIQLLGGRGDSLEAPHGEYVYTFVLETEGPPAGDLRDARIYPQGQLRVLWDSETVPDSGNWRTYADGVVVLECALSDVWTWKFYCAVGGCAVCPSFRADVEVVGGDAFEKFSSGGQGLHGKLEGFYCPVTNEPFGSAYSAAVRVWLELEEPVASRAVSWSRIKAFYK